MLSPLEQASSLVVIDKGQGVAGVLDGHDEIFIIPQDVPSGAAFIVGPAQLVTGGIVMEGPVADVDRGMGLMAGGATGLVIIVPVIGGIPQVTLFAAITDQGMGLLFVGNVVDAVIGHVQVIGVFQVTAGLEVSLATGEPIEFGV
jgi:hypothetical protein